MKKVLFTTLMMGLLICGVAKATNENVQGWSCGMEFTAKGKGLQLIVGKFKMNGLGLLQCENDMGDYREIPVRVTIGGKVIQAQVAAGWLTVHGHAKALGVAAEPESLFGKYAVTKVQFAVIGGVGTQVGFEVEKNDNLAFNMQLQTVKGFGFALGADKMVIEPLN